MYAFLCTCICVAFFPAMNFVSFLFGDRATPTRSQQKKGLKKKGEKTRRIDKNG